jgi:Fur family ferric uptake transcriptional regulator
MSRMSNIDVLRRYGLRPTAQRLAVFNELSTTQQPITARELFERLAHHAIDPATVHRILGTMREAGLVHVVEQATGGSRYVLRSATSHGHVLECNRCHATLTLATCHMTRLDRRLSRDTGWKDVTHAARFYGTCPRCA